MTHPRLRRSERDAAGGHRRAEGMPEVVKHMTLEPGCVEGLVEASPDRRLTYRAAVLAWKHQ